MNDDGERTSIRCLVFVEWMNVCVPSCVPGAGVGGGGWWWGVCVW